MIIEFYCPICMELYQNTDLVYTTQCGHVFHQNCLHNWLLRSSTCPECRRMCSAANTFKIFIKSRDSEQLVEQQKKLDQKILAITELEDKLLVAEQEQLQYTRDKEFAKVLSECLENELNEKRLEIKKLREDLEAKEKTIAIESKFQPTVEKISVKDDPINCGESEVIANKNKIIKELENKLSEKSLELEKEIRNSTMLIVDKMKLQQQLIDAGISGSIQRGHNKFTADTNQLNHQLKKSMHNANTTVNCAAGGAENTNSGTKKRLEKPVFDLFTYAKRLTKAGFKTVFFNEDKIYARRDDATEKIQIFSKTQVDALFRHFRTLSTNTQRTSAAAKPTQCDENYYAL